MNQMLKKSQVFTKIAECLYRNGNRDYYALVKVNGKQIRRSLKTNDLAIAKRRLVEFRAKAERLEGEENRNFRFEELGGGMARVDQVRPQAEVLRPPARRAHRSRAVLSRDADEGDRLRRNRCVEAEVSARSHNIEIESLKIILRYACDRGILLDNAAEKFKRRKQPKSMIDLPSHAEFRVLVKTLRDAPLAVASGATAMVEFLAYSGMRVGEAREVRLRDVNLDLGSVLITGGELGTKNHQERVIPLFPNLRNLLMRVMSARGVTNMDDRIFNIASPRGAMKLACKRAGLKQFSVHPLRHFFASNAIESGINFKVISEWLGHSDG